jgi:hypothetical protein
VKGIPRRTKNDQERGASRWTRNLIMGEGRMDKKEVPRLEGENVRKRRN